MPNAIDMHENDARTREAQRVFVTLWTVVTLLKLVLATQLPLFVDEAFYWQEGQHPAWAYSDLPGLTAWLIRIGVELAGNTRFGVRLPFLLIAAALPWMMVHLVRREFDERTAWLAGSATVLLPLAGTLGLLALPDVPMALATLLCIDAGARLLRKVDHGTALLLALGLAIGALSHYRFIAVIGVGAVALLLLPQGRRALRDPRVWVAIAFGVAAWVPLLAWNLDNAEAGLRFQLVDRHPWSLHASGVLFLPTQLSLVTPLLFVALLWAAWRSLRNDDPVARLLSLLGGLMVLGFFLLGFLADTERVSFHWPLPGYLALLPLLPALLATWPRWLQRATWGLAAAGLAAIFAYYVAVSIPAVRTQSAEWKWYPANFAGWDELADAVRDALTDMPPDTRVVADNFKVGAELGFMLDDPAISVLPHPLNHAHGRAPQLSLWGLESEDARELAARPMLLVVGEGDVKFSESLGRYQYLCSLFGALPPPRIVNADHGAKRFVLFSIPAGSVGGQEACVTPAIAHIDRPRARETVSRTFEVTGWAIKEGVGVAEVRITLDGVPVATAEYGRPNAWVADFWRGRSEDPNHPGVGFVAEVDGSRLRPGRRWLGIEVVGADGSRETMRSVPIVIAR